MKLRLRLDSGMSSKPTVSRVKKHTCRCDTSSTKTPNGFAQPSAKRCELERHSHLILESTKERERHCLMLCVSVQTHETRSHQQHNPWSCGRDQREQCARVSGTSKRHIKTVSFHFVNVHVRSCGNMFFFLKKKGTEKLQRLAVSLAHKELSK